MLLMAQQSHVVDPGKLGQVDSRRCVAATIHQEQCLRRCGVPYRGLLTSPHVSQGIVKTMISAGIWVVAIFGRSRKPTTAEGSWLARKYPSRCGVRPQQTPSVAGCASPATHPLVPGRGYRQVARSRHVRSAVREAAPSRDSLKLIPAYLPASQLRG